MMQGYARVRGLKRRLVTVPVLTPKLSSYWVHLITPISANIARPLIKGLGNEVVVKNPGATQMFPGITLLDYETAVEFALRKMDRHDVETSWSDALTSSQGKHVPVALVSTEGMIIERRQRRVQAEPDRVFRSFAGLGGPTGWLYMNWAWKIRGMMDRLVGGVGMRRQRRNPDTLRSGDSLDFWRVEAVEPDRLIRLRAEMKVPGRAWLEFEASPESGGITVLTQSAFFEPKGLFGLLYWYALYPIHALIFSGLIRKVAQRAES
jgi:hypothetical protein